MLIRTSDDKAIKPFIKRLTLPQPNSHKGQNGRVLIIGGSSLFHAASLWAAETASHLVDIVHYCSTKENNQIFLSLKKKFRNGIVISKKDLLNYINEDEAILIGPGMLRKNKNLRSKIKVDDFEKILKIKDEGEYTYYLTKYLIESFPEKKFVFDAGSLQMMEKEWLLKLKTPAIITPHQQEFERLFGINILTKSIKEKEAIVLKTAQKYQTIILLKAVVDIISDGKQSVIIEGGNQGLTKGGSGDLLAGMTVGFYAKNSSLTAAVLASFLIKKTAEDLYHRYGYWYNIDNLIDYFPQTILRLIS